MPRHTKEQFIEKANRHHMGKYDYSEVVYKTKEDKVCIICPHHGPFEQRAGSHMRGSGCSICGSIASVANKCLDKEGDLADFMDKANRKHGNKYDYSKIKYTKRSDSIIIICPRHGEFTKAATIHLNGSGCTECSREDAIGRGKLSIDVLKSRFIAIHKNKYDYSKIEDYNSVRDKITIICKEHGEFTQRICDHLSGSGCSICCDRTQWTTELFIKESNKKYNDKYDYSQVVHEGVDKPIAIICPIHGEFHQTAYNHLKSQFGCPACAEVQRRKSKRNDVEKLIIKAKEVHNNIYSYDKFEYIGLNKKGIITCSVHGDFLKSMYNHIDCMSGCQKCLQKSQFSVISICWLSQQPNFDDIQHALLAKGEYNIGKFKADGYHKGTNTIYEFHGCAWHGCCKCRKDRDKILHGKTYAERYDKTTKKEEMLKALGYRLIKIWECDFMNYCQENKIELPKLRKELLDRFYLFERNNASANPPLLDPALNA